MTGEVTLPAFQVEETNEMHEVTKYKPTELGLEQEIVTEQGGYMVYFPRGHSIRVKSLQKLKKLNLSGDPSIVVKRLDGVIEELEQQNIVTDLKQIVKSKTKSTPNNLKAGV